MLDARVPGRVGGLDVAFVEEGYVVVVVGIFAGDLRRMVGGTVVDDEDLGVCGGVREEGIKGVAKAGGVVVDGNYDAAGHHKEYNSTRSRLFDNRVMLRCL